MIYGMIPQEVILDEDLAYSAKVVFSFLALSWRRERGPFVSVGERLIAKSLGMSRITVVAGLRQLENRRHIIIQSDGKTRAQYTLRYSIFGYSDKMKIPEPGKIRRIR